MKTNKIEVVEIESKKHAQTLGNFSFEAANNYYSGLVAERKKLERDYLVEQGKIEFND